MVRYVIFDTNVWIYLLEGRSELTALKKQIAQKQIIPILTPVVFAEVLGWQEMTTRKKYPNVFCFP